MTARPLVPSVAPAAPLPAPTQEVPRRLWRAGAWEAAPRALAEEVPVALVYDGTTQAVMMASPADLEDFALGFTLTEGFARLEEVARLEILTHPATAPTAAGGGERRPESGPADAPDRAPETGEGPCATPAAPAIEARIWLAPAAGAHFQARRRSQLGPVGCGLCGIDSLAAALRPLPRVAPPQLQLSPAEIPRLLDLLRRAQPLHDLTHAVHAAAFWQPGAALLVREDVGRHNALDKLAGALARTGRDPAAGALLLTSRISVDMVQKAAMIGAGLIVAASAPTALARDSAARAGITLCASVRAGGFELYPPRGPTSPLGEGPDHAA